MSKKIVFVGGIHGVGKTKICQDMASMFEIIHLSAGEMISRQASKESFKGKEVENVERNQELLLTALDQFLRPDQWYLLDGHFCLLSKTGKTSKVPRITFDIISPKGVIVLIDEPEEIYQRLVKRDGTEYDLALLTTLQEEEVKYAKCISNSLRIPCLIVTFQKDKDEISTFLRQLINNPSS